MDKDQVLQKIESLIKDASCSAYSKGRATGFIDACLDLNILDFDEWKQLSRRALGIGG